ncbi:glutaredoxin family protein [Kingella negevensis]|uniref:glutaredoxin family protein n=1 Tax=Kingella negevensis TaxID=1522312 RepID=UPI00050A1AD7|nr:glutaredoxin family protein [Kingella negevensis]MDK4680374.1 glutaredoxin family protein [Kingella negevensis]MDK4681904.1 glutaredoxin family protein [Kingella negevensis]MDK4685272.1 glutaredoxin family protein [Kingella negevensis]MDK4689307.1 glutaredoxin family protein [Kingella negevensis]MDK4690101.1 glutaredoxin family protein [Kingella negevensis]
MKLTLIFREYCGLCHQMQNALLPFQKQYGFELEIVEIDDFPELEQKYNELVPVLLHGETEICHWHLDETGLHQYLMNLQAA